MTKSNNDYSFIIAIYAYVNKNAMKQEMPELRKQICTKIWSLQSMQWISLSSTFLFNYIFILIHSLFLSYSFNGNNEQRCLESQEQRAVVDLYS